MFKKVSLADRINTDAPLNSLNFNKNNYYHIIFHFLSVICIKWIPFSKTVYSRKFEIIKVQKFEFVDVKGVLK